VGSPQLSCKGLRRRQGRRRPEARLAAAVTSCSRAPGASLAEYERELIHERAAVARQAARARGKQTGRPRALTSDQVRIAQRMREVGESMSTICTALKVARSTLYRALGDADPAVAG
jgi:hypothetical protein